MIIPIIQASAQTQQRGRQLPDNRPRTASISGRVTVGGNPAVNARIGLAEVNERNALGNQDFSMTFAGMNDADDYSALTDADGRDRISGLPAGNYEARLKMKAYVAEKKSDGNDLARRISLDEGETASDVDFSLVRGGVITGVVTDAGGRPLISGRVQLQSINDQGQKQPYMGFVSLQMFETDDRRVYRIYGLRAGRYLVSASGEGGFQHLGSTSGKYPRTWHPDTDDESQAKIIEVKEGGEVPGVDIKFGLAKRTYEASGRVVDDATGQPIPKVSLMCMQTKVDGPGFGGWSGQVTTDQQGNFRFNGLSPGEYEVMMMNLMAFLPGGGDSDHYSERNTFEVKAGDVENIEIRAKVGATVSGVVVIEGANDASGKSALSQSVITYNSSRERSGNPENAAPIEIDGGGMPSMIKADGSFRITGIRPGKVTFDVANFTGKSMSVIRVDRNGADVSEGIHVKAGEAITGVRVVVGQGTAVIRGQVNVVGGALPEGWRMNVHASRTIEGRDGRFCASRWQGAIRYRRAVAGRIFADADGDAGPRRDPWAGIRAPSSSLTKSHCRERGRGTVTLMLDLKK